MFRDEFKDKNYFLKFVADQKRKAEKYTQKRETFSKNDSKYHTCQIYLQGIYYDMLNAECSLGASADELKQIAELYLSCLTRDSLYYLKVAEALSLMILFDINPQNAEMLFQFSEFEDHLLGSLKEYVKNGTIENDIPPSEDYKVFDDYVTGRIDLQAFIQFMEKKWYSTCKDCAWYNAHKNKFDVYAGYWSWIAPALIKIRGDHPDKEVKYVPDIQ